MTSRSLRDAFRAFTTTCALITVNGPKGPNVMAAEWTFNVSYDPFLIAVHVGKENVTHDEIIASGEFGVNLVTEDQGGAMRFAGHFSKADTEKLSSTAFDTYPGKRIRAPMIRGSLLNAECRLVQRMPIGDHTAFIGEVVEFSVDPEARPLILHRGSHRLGERLERRAGVVVASTPSRLRAGQAFKVDAELSLHHEGTWSLALVAEDGVERVLRSVHPDSEGTFAADLEVPEDAAPGHYALVARAGDLEGRAQVDILER